MNTIGLIVLVILGFSIVKKMLSVFCLMVTFIIAYFYFYPESYNSSLAYATELLKSIPHGFLPSFLNPSKVIPALK